ncbi:hypothetical protein OG689_44045 [Kitasatospora sp. NBC_00240]|uniref:hypothetical protein n=1 Tax=Kitasatospora sp. NBC_00240 TaxID=2903567 RepID=UPI002254FA4C|nr:hypothetical protein [Kitasatospora sp. NBC_00240]MCX5216109.1 hypothetical protein [Kitasatospora sp. NBC_00240]
MSSRPRPIPPPECAPQLAARLLPDVAVAGVPDHGPPLWRVVEVRVNGTWRPGVLSAWRRLPLGWAGHVRWSPGAYGAAWVLHTPWSLRPAVLLHPAPTAQAAVAAGRQGAPVAGRDDTRTPGARRGPGPHRT